MYKIRKTKNKNKPYCLDYRKTINGITYGHRKFFKSKNEAITAGDNLNDNGELKEEKLINNDNKLIRDVFYEYARKYKGNRKQKRNKPNKYSTIRDKISRYDNYLDNYFKDNKLSYITTKVMSDLSNYIQELEDIKTGDQISEGLMYHLWTDIKTMIKYAYDKEYIKNIINIHESDQIYKPSINKPKSWSQEEFDLFINVVDDDLYKAIFYTLALCGLRKSEMRGLKYKNVNFINNTLRVETQLIFTKKGDESLKTESSYRTVNAPDIVISYINKLKLNLLKTGITENEIRELYVYVNSKNNPVAAETLRQHYRHYVDIAGVEKYPIHYLRHFYGTLLIANGASIPYVQDQMGHSRSDTTVLKYYAAVTTKETNNNMKTLNDLYKVEDINETNKDVEE